MKHPGKDLEFVKKKFKKFYFFKKKILKNLNKSFWKFNIEKILKLLKMVVGILIIYTRLKLYRKNLKFSHIKSLILVSFLT